MNTSKSMTAGLSHAANHCDSRGFSLIEVMIAMTLGLLLAIGIISLFGNVGRVNQAQNALARLQENGRAAMTRIVDDLRAANGQYCTNSGGAGQLASGSAHSYQDTLRAPMVYAKTLTLPDWGTPLPPTGWSANTPYPLTPRYFLQGYECPANTCTPTIPAAASLPAIGTSNNQRAAAADVLTVRAVRAQGWSITNQVRNGNYLASLDVAVPASNPLNFGNGDLALLADCSSSRIVAGTVLAGSGTATFTPANNFDDTKVAALDATGDARLFNFTRDFRTVTYYLAIQDDPVKPGRKLSSLIRRVNGGAAGIGTTDAIVDGVERLDFRYGVEAMSGATYFLAADEVNNNTLGLTCPPAPPGFDQAATVEAGCLWRAVKSIEVFLLLNTVDDLGVSAEEEKFFYSLSGTTAQTPTATLPSGLPKGSMFRREFRALVTVRNYLP